jgi:heptosyltransferase-3
MQIDKKSIRKILVLRYRSIGDILLSFPALESLRLAFPQAQIDMVIDDKFRDICYAHPHINRLILYRRGGNSLWDEMKFIWKIRRGQYDAVVDLHCGPRSAVLTRLSGARYRIGSWATKRSKMAYNVPPVPWKGEGPPHSVEAMLNIIEPLKLSILHRKSLFLAYSEEDKNYIRNFLADFDVNRKPIMVHPGGRVDVKKLPVEKMGQIVRWLSEEFGARVILAGADCDLPDISAIASASRRKCLIATNLKLGRLAALIDSCGLFIGNDSGPMHMAAALGVPAVAFFGPSDPRKWGPWQAKGTTVLPPKMACMPCGDDEKCGYAPTHCMTRIEMSEIKSAIRNMLAKSAAAVPETRSR